MKQKQSETERLHGAAAVRPAGGLDRVGTRASLLPVRVVLDAVAVAAALGLAALLRFGLGFLEVTESSPITARSHWTASVLWGVAVLLAITANRLYDEDTLFLGGGELARVVRSVIEAAAAIPLFVFVTQSFYVSRSWFALTVVFSLLFIAAERLALRGFLRRARASGRHRRPVILVSRAEEDTGWFVDPTGEFEVVDSVDATGFQVLVEHASPDAARGVVVMLRARDFSHEEFWGVLVRAGQLGWSAFVHSPVRSVGRDRLTLRDLAGHAVVKVAPPTLTGARAVAKRTFDLVLALILLVVLAPVLLVIAIVLLFGSGRPVLYRQERVGQGGRSFSMVKFRTMRADAEPTGAAWTSRDDPRRTGIGRVLRRTSVDELPQLWNVIKGEMSLVGPRPEQAPFATEFGERFPWYPFRHRIKPGITGWAQSHSLRGDSSLDARTEFDNWYIENWSIWLDLKILALTLREIVRGENAY